MRNIIAFIVRNYFVILFAILELFSLFLLFLNNEPHHSRYISAANFVSGGISEIKESVFEYFNLQDVNEALVKENRKLRNELKKSYKSYKISEKLIRDSLLEQQYVYIDAKVVNQTVSLQKNYLTINKGSRHGIRQGLGVICSEGIVGIVKDVSRDYSTVISVLNTTVKFSAMLSRNGYFGSAYWDGVSNSHIKLSEIPFHVKLKINDKVVTSSYSAIFPTGVPIGIVESFSKETTENFYDITLKLTTDFGNLQYVYVVDNLFKESQKEIEEEVKDE